MERFNFDSCPRKRGFDAEHHVPSDIELLGFGAAVKFVARPIKGDGFRNLSKAEKGAWWHASCSIIGDDYEANGKGTCPLMLPGTEPRAENWGDNVSLPGFKGSSVFSECCESFETGA